VAKHAKSPNFCGFFATIRRNHGPQNQGWIVHQASVHRCSQMAIFVI
jgi:hypothetical protein